MKVTGQSTDLARNLHPEKVSNEMRRTVAGGSVASRETVKSDGLDHLEILVNASEAYPRLEQLFLGAQSNISMGFRLFDLRTKLRSASARATGERWCDLFVHTLNRGVPIKLVLSDFDPVMAHDMHEQSWQFMAIACGINELTAPGAARLTVRCVMHPARGGIVPRLAFAAKTRKELSRIVKSLNDDPDPEGRLRASPGLRGLLHVINGKVCAKKWALPQLQPVTLHHKMAVFDNATTYIGGLDLNERRFDDEKHQQPAQDTWHDLQLITRDLDVAASASAYLDDLSDVIDRKAEVNGLAQPFLATLSRRRRQNIFHLAPETVCSTIAEQHLSRIKTAKNLIYLETQYFRDRDIVRALASAARREPGLHLIVLLPAAPEALAFSDEASLDGRFGEYLQARAIRRVRRAFGERFLAVSPVQPRRPSAEDVATERATLASAPIIYVHSKVAIFDDNAAIVSSANLNGRSMNWDAEAGLLLTSTSQVLALKAKVFGRWLGDEIDRPEAADFEVWRRRAVENVAKAPEKRSGFIVPYDLDAAKKAGVPLPGAPEEMV
ncbi:phospholipase D family protein [Flavimaricola marinus]|uniref:Phospholipase D n=1 Tax=Flavimaricola marinus TaxID=1819565 RepID=A0A238LKR5_9RHOB|nr:phospholipase D-like domain-containing protein [Flavimaricola marinus]SMY09984.1 cardiolipin synthetase [Flavimaricola marinus]